MTSVAARRAMNRIRGPLPCIGSGGPLVLVNDASENGVSTDHGVDVRFGARDRRNKAEPAMRSSRVVVPDVAPKDPLEMAARDDEEEVEAANQLEGATRQTVEERQGHAIILAGASWHAKPGGGSN